MAEVIGVRFETAGRVYYFDAMALDLAVGDRVVVDTEGGRREAVVAIAPHQVIYSDLRGPLSPVLEKVDP